MSLYDDASLIMYPSGYKASKIYSLKPTDGAGDLTFTRASTATRVNEDGLIESVATGVPRIDYTGGGCGKLLLEPQRTNLLTFSEDVASQTLQNSPTITSNTAISPNGYMNADKLTPTISGSYTGSLKTGIAAGTYTISMFAKADGKQWVFFYQIGGAAGANGVWYNVSTGVVGNTGSDWTNAKIENYGSGWYRVSATVTFAGGSNYLYWVTADADGSVTTTPSGSDGLLLWGLSYEAGAYATSYIPTVASSVTRLADAASKSGISSLINSEEGVFYFEIAAQSNSITTSVLSISNGTSADTLYAGFSTTSNTIQAQLVVGGVAQTNMSYVISDRTELNKVAILYQNNNHKMYVNGVEASVDTSGIVPSANTFDRLIFNLGQGSFSFFGNCQSVMVFPSALSDTELATLTTL